MKIIKHFQYMGAKLTFCCVLLKNGCLLYEVLTTMFKSMLFPWFMNNVRSYTSVLNCYYHNNRLI